MFMFQVRVNPHALEAKGTRDIHVVKNVLILNIL
jgi:hypothetical protein